ncbi:MAG: AfsR/SARP family transcriptional regulator [Acidimicrobiales bacterium]
MLEPERSPRQPARVLVTEPPGYVLRVPPGNVDAVRFAQLVERGEESLSAGSPQEADAILAEALALWRGARLADLAGEAFILPEVARLTELHVRAWEHRIDAWLLLGRHAAATAELERLVGEHPFRERFWGLWMIALYRAGRQAEAVRAYQQCRRVLQDDLGLEPGPELRRLEQAILSQDPALDLRPPPASRSGPGPEPPAPAQRPAPEAPPVDPPPPAAPRTLPRSSAGSRSCIAFSVGSTRRRAVGAASS